MQVSIRSPNNCPDETGTALFILGLFSGKSWDLPLLCLLQYLTWRQTPPLPTVLMALHQQWLVPSPRGWEAAEECDPGGGVQGIHLCVLLWQSAGRFSCCPHLACVRYPQLNIRSQNHVPVVLCFVENFGAGVVLFS